MNIIHYFSPRTDRLPPAILQTPIRHQNSQFLSPVYQLSHKTLQVFLENNLVTSQGRQEFVHDKLRLYLDKAEVLNSETHKMLDDMQTRIDVILPLKEKKFEGVSEKDISAFQEEFWEKTIALHDQKKKLNDMWQVIPLTKTIDEDLLEIDQIIQNKNSLNTDQLEVATRLSKLCELINT